MMRNGRWMLAAIVCIGVALAMGAQAGEPGTPVGEVTEAPGQQQVWPWNSVEEPWRAVPALPFNVNVHGWFNFGYTHNTDEPASDFNGVQAMNDRHADVQFHQAYLIIEKVADPSELGFDVGGRIDLLWGTDARFTEPAGSGLGTSWNSHEFYGYDLPQFYVELAAGTGPVTGRVKAGRFYTIVGYETVPAPANFFYSHAYTMMYGEPFTHTGVLASVSADLPAGSQITVMGGFDRGWNRFHHNPRGNDTGVLGGTAFTTNWGTEQFDTSVTYTFTRSEETANPFIAGLKDDAYVHSFVFQQGVNTGLPMVRRILYVFQYDYGKQKSGSPFTGLDAEWWGTIHYLILEINRVWSVGVRMEKFEDHDGSRVGGIGRRRTGSPIVPFGFSGNFNDITVGVNCKPTANVILRAEARHDYYDGISGFGPRPYDDGRKDHQTTYGVDAIILF